MLRKAKVVGKFVEFYGPGAAALPVPDRATIANMAPEYGATMGFFPIDEESVELPRAPPAAARSTARPSRTTTRPRACGASRSRAQIDYSQVVELDLATVKPERRRPEAPAGPHRAAR